MKNRSTPIESILGVCGLDSTTQCGENMFSKVTTLFGSTSDVKESENENENENQNENENDNENNHDKDVATVQAAEISEKRREKNDEPLNITNEKSPKTPKKNPSDTDPVVVSPASKSIPIKFKLPKLRKFKSKTSMEDSAKSPTVSSPKSDPKNEADNNDVDTGGNDDGNADGNADGDGDLDAMLANLEFPDFDMSMDENMHDNQNNEIIQQDPWDTVDWTERMNREEVYSKRYRPKQMEQQELDAMASRLGLSKSNDLVGKLVSMTLGIGSRMIEDMQNLFFGEHSILLSIIPVQWNGKLCDLLLLTDGFVLKYQSVSAYSLLEKRYETCHLWNAVEFCERMSPFAVAIQVDSSTRYELEAVDGGETLETIFKHLERVLTQHDMFHSDQTHTLGWQYLRIRKPAFTAAITGDPKLLVAKQMAHEINELDAYNRYAPLHYAVLQDECNIEVIKSLLKAGADPNLVDGDERSAMYYAERNEVPEEITQILKGGGGQKSKLAEMEMRGELFSGVDAANQKSKERRERERVTKEQEQSMKDQKAADAKAKAEGVQSEMSKGMAALIERGEKIERMDQKTKELQAEAKTFGDLASRLKDEVKNKKWYQL